MIIIVFANLFYQSLPANKENVYQVSGIIEKTSYVRGYNEYRFRVYIDSECYQFSDMGIMGSYSNKELYDSIKEGEKITLQYCEKFGVTGKANWVVDARTDTKVYRSIDEYNAQKKGLPTFVIIIFVFFEIVWALVLSIYLILFCKKNKNRKKRL